MPLAGTKFKCVHILNRSVQLVVKIGKVSTYPQILIILVNILVIHVRSSKRNFCVRSNNKNKNITYNNKRKSIIITNFNVQSGKHSLTKATNAAIKYIYGFP